MSSDIPNSPYAWRVSTERLEGDGMRVNRWINNSGVNDHLRAGPNVPQYNNLLSGLRGSKERFVVFLICGLTVFVLAEIILTFLLISALNIAPTAGFVGFILPSGDSNAISFPLPVTSQRLLFHGSNPRHSEPTPPRILSFSNEPLDFISEKGLDLRVGDNDEDDGDECGARLFLNGSRDGLDLVANSFSWNRRSSGDDDFGGRSFCLGNCDDGDDDNDDETGDVGPYFPLPTGSSSPLSSATSSQIFASKIRSLVTEPLELKSGSRGVVSLRGNEGVSITSGAGVRFEAKRQNADIVVKVARTVSGARYSGGVLKLDAKNVTLGRRGFARRIGNGASRLRSSATLRRSTKLCVCASNGRLFRVPNVSTGCLNLAVNNNPCLTL